MNTQKREREKVDREEQKIALRDNKTTPNLRLTMRLLEKLENP